jgi:hypothetical protein
MGSKETVYTLKQIIFILTLALDPLFVSEIVHGSGPIVESHGVQNIQMNLILLILHSCSPEVC